MLGKPGMRRILGAEEFLRTVTLIGVLALVISAPLTWVNASFLPSYGESRRESWSLLGYYLRGGYTLEELGDMFRLGYADVSFFLLFTLVAYPLSLLFGIVFLGFGKSRKALALLSGVFAVVSSGFWMIIMAIGRINRLYGWTVMEVGVGAYLTMVAGVMIMLTYFISKKYGLKKAQEA